MKFHKTCSTLPIYNFYKIVEDNNLKYLIIGFNELEDDVQLSEEQNTDLKKIFSDIIIEYYILTDNKKALIK